MAVYSHCELCRRHHDEGRRHIYQRKHKERLKEVLGKFAEKAGIAVVYTVYPHINECSYVP